MEETLQDIIFPSDGNSTSLEKVVDDLRTYAEGRITRFNVNSIGIKTCKTLIQYVIISIIDDDYDTATSEEFNAKIVKLIGENDFPLIKAIVFILTNKELVNQTCNEFVRKPEVIQYFDRNNFNGCDWMYFVNNFLQELSKDIYDEYNDILIASYINILSKLLRSSMEYSNELIYELNNRPELWSLFDIDGHLSERIQIFNNQTD